VNFEAEFPCRERAEKKIDGEYFESWLAQKNILNEMYLAHLKLRRNISSHK
jgi:hypothetical protein